jgi:hypothetical protein
MDSRVWLLRRADEDEEEDEDDISGMCSLLVLLPSLNAMSLDSTLLVSIRSLWYRAVATTTPIQASMYSYNVVMFQKLNSSVTSYEVKLEKLMAMSILIAIYA